MKLRSVAAGAALVPFAALVEGLVLALLSRGTSTVEAVVDAFPEATVATVASVAEGEARTDDPTVPLAGWLGVSEVVDALDARLPCAITSPLGCESPGLLSRVETSVERWRMTLPWTAKLSLER